MADNETGAKPEVDDDRPTIRDDSLPPEVQAPLLAYKGEEPPAPQWFKDAIAQAPERSFVDSLGSRLEVLTWGARGKPGLLFVHGNSAHADWWSFIAPFFAEHYRVAAFSLAGMGASDWRERYVFADFAKDAEAVARAAGLYDSGEKPIYIGHSFGGGQVFYAGANHPEQMRAAIMIDTGFGGPPPRELENRMQRMAAVRAIPTVDKPAKVYGSIAQALARFRLMPPQAVENPFIADFIARRSLKQAPRQDGPGQGWAWRFDPMMWNKLDRTGMTPDPANRPPIATPMAHVYGGLSARTMALVSSGGPTIFPPGTIWVEIPEARHHIMIDQPLALVAAIRALLAAWAEKWARS